MLDRMREWLGGGRPEVVPGFNSEQAIAAFGTARDAAGDREGVRFAEGEKCVVTNYAPGTVFRETWTTEDEGETHGWWCVGENNGKWVSLFLAVSDGVVYDSPTLSIGNDELMVTVKTIPLDGEGKLIIEPGKKGIIIDRHLHSHPDFKNTVMLEYMNLRRTTEIRIFQLGVKQKEPETKRATDKMRQRRWVVET